ALTDGFDAAFAVLVAKPQERIRLPHARPRQLPTEQSLGVRADVRTLVARLGQECIDTSQRVGLLVGGIVARVGGASSRALAWVDFDELRSEIDLDRALVGASTHVL